MPHDVFISYRDSANDKAAAERVCAHLEAEGFSCWIAPRDVLEGDDYGAAIAHAVEECRIVVLIFSAAANESRQIARELKLADDAKKTVLPIRIENVSPSGNFAYFLGAAHWLDAFGGVREEHLKKLTSGLRKRLGSAGEVRVNPVETAPSVEVSAWMGTRARYTYVAVALVILGLIVWKQGGALLNTPKGGPMTGPSAPSGAVKGTAPRVNPADGLIYVFIPPGAFTMGCSPGDTECLDDEKPPHAEQIANGFWLGQTEVTQSAWAKVKGGSPSAFKRDGLPVEQVDWTQASDYCKAIGGRLPTEKEWEYAARAGDSGAGYGAPDAVAWYSGNSGKTTHPVGLKQPNAFGLHDMLGNVWEWTSDNYDAGNKVVRGGSWYSDAGYVRASKRGGGVPSTRNVVIGFRCVGEFR